LAGETILERQRSQKIRSDLVHAALLFALKRPVHQRSPAHAYPSPTYTEAALEEAPDLHGYKTKSRWDELTRTAILDKLASIEDKEGAIDPLTLFKLGTVAVSGQEVPTSEIFSI